MESDQLCSQCSLLLGADHSCIQSIAKLACKSNSIVKDNDELIDSQNIVLAKTIRDVQELKDQMEQMKAEFEGKIDDLSKKVEELKTKNSTVEETVQSPISTQHKALIDKLKSEGHIKSEKVFQVMCSVDFRNFGDEYTNTKYDINSILN